MVEDQNFISSVSFENHPAIYMKRKTKMQYYYALKYLIKQIKTSEHMNCRIELYKQFLMGDSNEVLDDKLCINSIVVCKFQPWRNKYKFWLICDIALIVNDYQFIETLAELIKNSVSAKQQKLIEKLLTILRQSETDIPPRFLQIKNLIEQYWANSSFASQKEQKIIITANMSAGKSTLINALTGRNIARTSQEVCTGNICYFYNKAFDDGRIHFNSNTLSYSADDKDIKSFKWDMPVSVATPFQSAADFQKRICLIDTPGVNSALSREHGKIAKKSINSEKYNTVLYIFNANKLGTDEEIAYLKWIAKNVPNEKLLFVMNKLDDFRRSDDSIELSIEGVKTDLKNVGFENPSIFPISAYFAYLIKKNASDTSLSEDEQDEYELYKRKFSTPEYNLSRFYNEAVAEDEYSFEALLKKSGVYYLEKKIYGGSI